MRVSAGGIVVIPIAVLNVTKWGTQLPSANPSSRDGEVEIMVDMVETLAHQAVALSQVTSNRDKTTTKTTTTIDFRLPLLLT